MRSLSLVLSVFWELLTLYMYFSVDCYFLYNRVTLLLCISGTYSKNGIKVPTLSTVRAFIIHGVIMPQRVSQIFLPFHQHINWTLFAFVHRWQSILKPLVDVHHTQHVHIATLLG